MKFTPENITELQKNEIFVFGSNEAGRHGAGAAKLALDKFGAEWGNGIGMQGQTYAIPTKNFDIHTLSLDIIKQYVDEFLEFAKYAPNFTFLVTQIGCGLAGYHPRDIAPMFRGASDNVILPQVFHENM
jgi:hypothetical protein